MKNIEAAWLSQMSVICIISQIRVSRVTEFPRWVPKWRRSWSHYLLSTCTFDHIFYTAPGTHSYQWKKNPKPILISAKWSFHFWESQKHLASHTRECLHQQETKTRIKQIDTPLKSILVPKDRTRNQFNNAAYFQFLPPKTETLSQFIAPHQNSRAESTSIFNKNIPKP